MTTIAPADPLADLRRTAAGTAGNALADSAKETHDRFLRLLVAQMNNQDPLNPLDNAQVTSQMAQINTVSGINTLNATVTRLLENFARAEAIQAAQLTGRTVLVAGNSLALGDAGEAAAALQLAQPADAVTIEVRDASGAVVRSIEMGATRDGIQPFVWDGATDAGARAAPGRYTFAARATAAGKEIAVTPLAAHRVDGVRQDSFGLQLMLSGLGPVSYSDIRLIL
jgi:flagellar basal-body rod modification protein FlgD